MNDNIMELAKSLENSYEEMYKLCSASFERIVNYKIKDVNLIEHTLDMALDIYTEKGFYLFLRILDYYKTVNYTNASEYLEILKEEREGEYADFVKKLKK